MAPKKKRKVMPAAEEEEESAQVNFLNEILKVCSKLCIFQDTTPKKKRKSVAEESQMDEILPVKKLRKRKKPKPDMGLVESYDYSAADTKIFSKGKKCSILYYNCEFFQK